ncbi:MAG TPA: hypothetical protein VNY34_05290, partial [Solirubrobacteraceae bacterium]|nr:hypothetical protein [Solirubrobacteraceae bacterium]
LALGALALAGCQTTAEKSAKLERAARRHALVSASGLSIAHTSSEVKVTATSVLRSAEGAVAIVELRNHSGHALRNVPLALTVKDARGGTLYQNNAAGLEAALVSVPSLPAHASFTWVDDQIPAKGAPAAVSARIGTAPAVPGSLPILTVSGVHPIEDPANGAGAAGTVSNRSGVTQTNLVVFGVARRAGRIVAAGRAVLPEVAAGSQMPVQIFLAGDPHGAQLQLSAPANSVGHP